MTVGVRVCACVCVCIVCLCLGQDRWFVMGSRAPLVIGILPSSAPAESAYVGDGLGVLDSGCAELVIMVMYLCVCVYGGVVKHNEAGKGGSSQR